MDAEPLIGRTLIGRFRIDRVLGRGGMATVYAAFDQQRGTPVALKVLKRELTRDAMILRRFEREAKAASHLSHPNVVEVVDWGVDQEEAFIAMELAQGLDLLKALAQERPMRQARAAVLLAQVCAALSAAHAKGIIHRDLKPENILLVPDPTEPGGERAKVLDFGIAKIMDVSKGGAAGDDPPSYVTKTALTRVGTIVGTPAYMSPEQCRGGDIDGRSDIYACGVLLYQLVTGELPFTGETPLHTAMRHIHAQPRPPSELRRNLDPQLEQVILKALAKWPGERQQTAEVLREELHAVVPQLPDRGDIVIPDRNAPRSAPAKPSPPQLSSGSRSPNSLQLASEGSTGGRLGSPQPGSPQPGSPQPGAVGPRPAPGMAAPPPAPTGAPPQANATDPIAAAPERQESKLIDSDPATRQHVGGPLGATPLRGVRLSTPNEPAPDTKANTDSAMSAPNPSLVPSTTRPETPAVASTGDAPPPVDDDDDEPRTFLMHTDDGGAPPATQASPPNAPAPPQADGSPRPVDVTTDPMEAARSTAKKDPVKPAIKTEPIAALRERLDSSTNVKEVPRVPARTDRSPGRAPPRLIKSTETGLTPTAGQGAPRPRGDAQPTPPIALAAIPPVPPGNGIGRTDRGPVPAPRTTGSPAAAAARVQAIASTVPAPDPVDANDDDEPATYIREPTNFAPPADGAPVSNNNLGRTLVMEEQAQQKARPGLAAAVNAPPPGVVLAGGAIHTQLGSPDPKAGPSPAASPTALSPYAEPFEDEAIRALKATSRIPDEPSNPPGAHPQPQLPGGPIARPDDPQIKATVRMNPQDTMARVHAQHGGAMHGHGGQPMAQGVPQSQGRIDPTLPGNATYGQLQPGQWNEPTVVRRKQDPYAQQALARSQKNGLMSQLSNLSGTTGLLIGVGLGLGLAAGLLIAFLLLR